MSRDSEEAKMYGCGPRMSRELDEPIRVHDLLVTRLTGVSVGPMEASKRRWTTMSAYLLMGLVKCV